MVAMEASRSTASVAQASISFTASTSAATSTSAAAAAVSTCASSEGKIIKNNNIQYLDVLLFRPVTRSCESPTC